VKHILPFHPSVVAQKGHGFHYKGQEFVHHSTLHHSQSSFHRVSTAQLIVILLLSSLVVMALSMNWHTTVVTLVAAITFLYFSDLLFNFYLIYRSFVKPIEIQVSTDEIAKVTNWPRYTIMCPLYKEWQVVPQFVEAMSKLTYPKDKLQIMFLLEADDEETITHVKKFNLPSYFDVIVVPDSKPKTKPKACNYGLKKATGEYITIYDAEDVPDILQLKKVIVGFAKSEEDVICIQAKLNFYNPHQNLLTRVFTAEYSLWFDLVLTGLQSINAPIPLGGTSNHFKLKNILHLKGWDSFNVTEDCDLGMRLVKNNYKTALINSITLEEANSDLSNWFWQRTRWIKGYMQTYLVHMRKPQEFVSTNWNIHLLTFQLVVGGKVLSMFINPFMWITTLLYFLYRFEIGNFIESFFPQPVLYMGVFSLLVGNFLYAYYYMIGCAKHGHFGLVKYVFLVPFYWLAMSAAAWVALYKLFVEPHHWSKTKHGLHLTDNNAVAQTYK
jgi:cellulose synthase/poly-beta-1,6-N-acetylglucosamine synthase-like glycosyltransferase